MLSWAWSPFAHAGGTRGNSPSWYLFVGGASLWALSAVVGTSMVSVGHLLGSGTAAIGLLGLALRGEVQRAVFLPSKRVFLFLFAWVALGHVVYVWARDVGGGHGVDLVIFTDLLQQFALHGAYFSHAIEQPGFADHFTPSLMLTAPLFWVAPTHLWLLGAKLVAFLSCPWLLYALGLRILGRASRCLWVLPSLWLVHTPIAYTVLHDFQPTLLAPPLVLLAFLLAFDRRWALLLVCLLLLGGLKEDAPLAGVAVGTYLLVERRDYRWGLGIATAATVVGLVVFFVAMPYFAQGPVPQHSRFDPTAFPLEKVMVFVVLVASLGGLPLVRPQSLLFAVPCYAVHLASGFDNLFSFRYHYQALPLAPLFVAALYGLSDLERNVGAVANFPLRAKQLAAATMGTLLIGLNGMLPWYSVRLFWPTSSARANTTALEALRSAVPKERALYTLGDIGLRMLPHPQLHLLDWRGPWDQDVAVRLSKLDEQHVVLLRRQPLEQGESGVYMAPVSVLEHLVEEGRYRARDLDPRYRLYEPASGPRLVPPRH